MPSEHFREQKRKGRWFEEQMRLALPERGFEVYDTDKLRYSQKKGVDCYVKIKDKDGTFKRNPQGRIICEPLEFKYDEMSEKTGNVYIEFDSLEKTISTVWFYGLKDGYKVETYMMQFRDLYQFVMQYAKDHPEANRTGGEWRSPAVTIDKLTFIAQPFIRHFRTFYIRDIINAQAA